MHEYDTVLKALLQSRQSTVLERITGARIINWLNVEFPEVQQTRVDLLGTTADPNRLVALELQSANDLTMPLRNAEYTLRVYRRYGIFPEHHVLFVGGGEMTMPSELVGPNFYFRHNIIDIRTLDEESLLSSPFHNDNILAILSNHRDRRETIRRILARIATLEGARRDEAFKKLMILSGLRKLGDTIRTEIKYMPILDDIMDHDVLGPAIREGMAKGKLELLRRLIGKRFGTVPTAVDDHLNKLSATELEDLSLRIFDAKTVEDLFNA